MDRSDPYLRAWWRQLRNRARVVGWWGRLQSLAIPLLTAALLMPLFQRVFLSFLDETPGVWPAATSRVALRVALVVVGWLSIDVYGALIRSENRPVLSLLPVDPAPVVRVQLIDVVRRRWWLLAGSAIVLGPIAWRGAPELYVAALSVVGGAFALGLTASALVLQFAIQAADDDRFAPLLDAIRGANVRAQAAFIYAPGLVLVIAGGLLGLASDGAVAAAGGAWLGAGWVALLFVLAALAIVPVPGLARRTWFVGSAVVSEIDARDASLADPEEAMSVYLGWSVRWLPAAVRRYALNDLRHGWRTRRTLVSAAFFAGLGALVVGWRADPEAPVWVAMTVAWGSFVVAANGVWLDRDEPAFLWQWLRADPVHRLPRTVGRLWVLVLWQLPIGALGAVPVLWFQGLDQALGVLGISVALAFLAAGLSMLISPLRERGFVVYGPLAVLMAAGVSVAFLEFA